MCHGQPYHHTTTSTVNNIPKIHSLHKFSPMQHDYICCQQDLFAYQSKCALMALHRPSVGTSTRPPCKHHLRHSTEFLLCIPFLLLAALTCHRSFIHNLQACTPDPICTGVLTICTSCLKVSPRLLLLTVNETTPTAHIAQTHWS